VVTLQRDEDEQVPPFSMKYLNRLSDLLFVLSRVISRANGGTEVLWQKQRPTIDPGAL
jgi:cob(I)alamin adenosyltransferase